MSTEISAMVAEHVMGKGPWRHETDWVYGEDPFGDGYGGYYGWWCRTCDGDKMPAAITMTAGAAYPPPARICHNYSLASYATDSRKALDVVDVLRKRGLFFHLSIDPKSQWVAVFVEDKNLLEVTVYEAFAATAPLAICLAALKVVGVDTTGLETCEKN